MRLHKTKKLPHSNGVKSQLIKWKKILDSYTYNRGLVTRIHKEPHRKHRMCIWSENLKTVCPFGWQKQGLIPTAEIHQINSAFDFGIDFFKNWKLWWGKWSKSSCARSCVHNIQEPRHRNICHPSPPQWHVRRASLKHMGRLTWHTYWWQRHGLKQGRRQGWLHDRVRNSWLESCPGDKPEAVTVGPMVEWIQTVLLCWLDSSFPLPVPFNLHSFPLRGAHFHGQELNRHTCTVRQSHRAEHLVFPPHFEFHSRTMLRH